MAHLPPPLCDFCDPDGTEVPQIEHLPLLLFHPRVVIGQDHLDGALVVHPIDFDRRGGRTICAGPSKPPGQGCRWNRSPADRISDPTSVRSLWPGWNRSPADSVSGPTSVPFRRCEWNRSPADRISDPTSVRSPRRPGWNRVPGVARQVTNQQVRSIRTED